MSQESDSEYGQSTNQDTELTSSSSSKRNTFTVTNSSMKPDDTHSKVNQIDEDKPDPNKLTNSNQNALVEQFKKLLNNISQEQQETIKNEIIKMDNNSTSLKTSEIEYISEKALVKEFKNFYSSNLEISKEQQQNIENVNMEIPSSTTKDNPDINEIVQLYNGNITITDAQKGLINNVYMDENDLALVKGLRNYEISHSLEFYWNLIYDSVEPVKLLTKIFNVDEANAKVVLITLKPLYRKFVVFLIIF